MNAHPGARPDAVPVPPAVRRLPPRRVLGASILLAWIAAAASALVFARVAEWTGGGGVQAADVAIAVALALVAAAAVAGGAVFSRWAESATERRLRELVVSRVLELGPVRIAGRSGTVLSLASDAVERIAHYRAGFLGPIIGALSTPLLVLAVMALTVDPVTAGLLALLLLLVPVIIGGFRKLVKPVGANYRRTQARLTSAFLEAIQTLGTLVLTRSAGRTAERLAADGERHRRGLMRLLAANQLLIFVVDAAFSLTIVVAAALIAGARVAQGVIGVGDAVAIVLMTTLVIGPVDVIGQFFYIGIGGRAAQQQLSRFLGAAHAGDRPAGATPIARGERGERPDANAPAIELRGVAAGWPGGPPVFSGLDLTVEIGERVALVGPSGAGKSTVSALLQAWILPTAGTVRVFGLDTVDADAADIRARLAVVEQRPFLFSGTVEDNLRLAAADASEGRLWDALETAGLADDVRRMPEALGTPVGDRGRLLSGGQAQRLAIARAVLRDAPLLILDEPTSEVDLAGEAAILAALDRLAAGRTVLMIAHRPQAILAADRVVRLVPDGAEA